MQSDQATFSSDSAASRTESRRVDVVEYGVRRLLVSVAVILGALLEILDTTIVNVALPTIQGNVGASQAEGTFVVTGYIVANVVVIPLSPWLQTRFGRKQYFAASIVIFTIASVMCGLSHDLWSLVFWRVVQGAGGGGLLSQAQAILRETYPSNLQGLAQSIFAMGAIVGPTVGPLLGGIITDNFSWQWCFFVNVPVGIVAATLTIFFLRNPEGPRRSRIDGVGVALLAIGLGSLQYVLDQGQQKDWFGDSTIVAFALLAAIGLGLFLGWELSIAKQPAVDLTVLRYRSVWAGSLLGMVLGVTLLGSLVTLPQFAQGPLGFTATLAGELILIRALPVMLLTPLVARLASSGRVDSRSLILVGFLLIAASNWLLAGITTPDASFGTFVGSLAVGGVGLALVFVPLSLVVFGSVPPRDVAKASAMFNLARQLGGSLATALLITLLDRSEAVHRSEIAGSIVASRPAVARYVANHGGSGSQTALSGMNAIVQTQSTVLGYADTSRDVALLTVVLSPLALLLRKPHKAGAPVAIE
jgi:DHA2 family multidrug resistance protein